MDHAPERGITITPAELGSEGVDTVLDIIARTGANAITMSTGIQVEAAPGEGVREPSLDVAGEVRVLDRPLWGRRVVHLRRYAAHPPDPALWRSLPWAPSEVAPPELRVDYVRQAIDRARDLGLRVHLQLAPYVIPSSQDASDAPSADLYRPQRFIGGSHPDAITFTGCLNHPVVRQLGRVRLTEIVRHYADVDGFVFDWVEYPTYFIDKMFTCFCDYCRDEATRLGYDWEQIRSSVRHLWDSLHTITPEQVSALIESGDWGDLVAQPEDMQAGFDAWLDFKIDSVGNAIRDLRAVLDEHGASHVTVSTNEPALPWGRLSGAAFQVEGGPVDVQRIKLYSFHWLMMVRWWTETGLTWNRGSAIRPGDLTRATMALFGLTLQDEPIEILPEDFGMPGPGKSHNLTPGSYTNRLEGALALRTDQAPLYPIVHAYRSVEDFASVLAAVRPFSRRGIWIQRYGYLSDEKLAVLRQEWSSA